MSMHETNTCPECKADLQGDPIPEGSRRLFGNKTHFSRVIGIYSQERDMTVAWRCPDCGFEEPRAGLEVG